MCTGCFKAFEYRLACVTLEVTRSELTITGDWHGVLTKKKRKDKRGSMFYPWKQATNIVPLLLEALTVPNPMCCPYPTEMAAQE